MENNRGVIDEIQQEFVIHPILLNLFMIYKKGKPFLVFYCAIAFRLLEQASPQKSRSGPRVEMTKSSSSNGKGATAQDAPHITWNKIKDGSTLAES
ncbi:hypothetical protein YC2023_014510 [Brassica napus]